MIYDFIWGINNNVIQESLPRTYQEIARAKNPICSVSGGSDSDIMLDIVYKLDEDKKVTYVFFDTGLEMIATKNHIKYLEDRYNIDIKVIKPKLPIPLAVKKYGQPFLSKKFSEYIDRLQKHNFEWEDGSYDELVKKYPNCQSALRWFTNSWGYKSNANIEKAGFLREFMLENPPKFKVSNRCCDFGKKQPADLAVKEYKADLNLVGIRKFEYGARSMAYKNCISDGKNGRQHFPLFWFKDDDKKFYEEKFDIIHSDAYRVYGCKRTGCAACPFSSRCFKEIEMLEKFEPNLAKAVNSIFKESYQYRKAYVEYRDSHKGKKNIYLN